MKEDIIENINELDEMKEMWKELNTRVTLLEEENRRLARNVTAKRFLSSTGELVRRYKRFMFVELIMAIIFPLMIYHNPFVVDKYRIITLVYWLIFFMGEVCVDFYLMNKVKEMDINNYSITRIAKEAKNNWKIHKIAIMIGLPVAIGAIILFALCMDANEAMIIGMIIGGTVGLMIGIWQLMKFRNDYINLQTEND